MATHAVADPADELSRFGAFFRLPYGHSGHSHFGFAAGADRPPLAATQAAMP